MLRLLRAYPDFRRLWVAQVVSQLGDWMGRVALLRTLDLLQPDDLAAGLGLFFALEVIARLLPGALLGPLAGPLADRLSRRGLMIVSDLLRALVVLGFLTLDGTADRPLLYLLLVAQMGLSIFFEAARSAALPATLPKEKLGQAYALSAATWSVMLSAGAFIGGWIVATWGAQTAWTLDAMSYLLSALVVARISEIPTPPAAERFGLRNLFFGRDLRRALRHVRERRMLPVVLTKGYWGMSGGFLVVLSLVGREGPVGYSAAFITGLLYAVRGLGTAIGPVLGPRLFGRTEAGLRRQILFGFGAGAAGYLLLALAPTLPVGLLAVAVGHMGGSALWVGSTTWYQLRVADAYRGRVAVLEYAGMTAGGTLGALVAGLTYDRSGSLSATAAIPAVGVIIGGVLWALATRQCAAARIEERTADAV